MAHDITESTVTFAEGLEIVLLIAACILAVYVIREILRGLRS